MLKMEKSLLRSHEKTYLQNRVQFKISAIFTKVLFMQIKRWYFKDIRWLISIYSIDTLNLSMNHHRGSKISIKLKHHTLATFWNNNYTVMALSSSPTWKSFQHLKNKATVEKTQSGIAISQNSTIFYPFHGRRIPNWWNNVVPEGDSKGGKQCVLKHSHNLIWNCKYY